MTNEETIKWIEGMKKGLFPWSDEVMNEICDTAISALSIPKGEYIKKEDLFAKTIDKNKAWLYTTNAEGKNLKEIVEDLPTFSVPEREKGTDLISRQKVINAIANTCFWLSADNWDELMETIDSVPSAVPGEADMRGAE